MDFLSRIDWHNHDGVNLGMINDFVRNQFYDRVLSRTVTGQQCTDIGFGTGLLSMLALRHGADHIRAFESDNDRYLLGCEVIQRLRLANKIELINERYDNSFRPSAVTFSETVNGNLWWEGLWNSLPRGTETLFMPRSYFLEIWALPVPRSFAQGLCRPGNTQQYFAPGVDIDPAFQQTVNTLIGAATNTELPLPQGIVRFERQQETDWGWIPYLRAVQAGSVVASYCASHWQPEKEYFELTANTSAWHNQTVLIVPRMGMQHDAHKLYLDQGHWGPGENPILLCNPQGNLHIRHSVVDGTIEYQLGSI
jgi:16S rRNA G966 N2-methylase RsmD